MTSQVEYSRKEISYIGSAFYGYATVAGNAYSIDDELTSIFKDEIIYCDIAQTGEPVAFGIGSDTTVGTGKYLLTGTSDPGKALTCTSGNCTRINRNRNGSFTAAVDIRSGQNTFVFVQDGVEYTITIYGG